MAVFHKSKANGKIQEDTQLDIIEHIQKLAELKNMGILTEEEFLAKKAELLAKL